VSSLPPYPRINRAAELRQNTQRLMEALDLPETLLLPVWREKSFFTDGAEARGLLRTVREAGQLVDRASEIVWLGQLGTTDCFALDLSEVAEPQSLPGLDTGAKPVDLMFVGSLLPKPDAELLVYARGMLNWHRKNRFCGSCGQPTKPKEGGHVRECPNEQLKHFPRTDPAIMLLVAKGDRCVLGRQRAWPTKMVSVIAGFVEPGESLEDAAIREAKEELGISVSASSIRYFRSQPWPFPASLMLGFTGLAENENIVLDGQELEEARWYTKDELRSPQGFFYPPPFSLAHHLIKHFIDG
jgi:NAD+ diphosphatase